MNDSDALFDGDLDAAGRKALAARLAADSTALDEAIEELCLVQRIRCQESADPELTETICARCYATPAPATTPRPRSFGRRRQPIHRWRSSRRAIVGLLAAAILISCGLLLLPTGGAGIATVTATGKLQIWRDGRLLPTGDHTLRVGDELRLEGPDAVELRLDAGDHLRLDGGSRLRLGPADDAQLRLQTGQIEIQAVPRAADRPLRCRTRHALVQVLGTRFRLAVTDTGTVVWVDHGRVLVQGENGIERILGAGEDLRVTSAPPAPLGLRWDFEAGNQSWYRGRLVPRANGGHALQAEPIENAAYDHHGVALRQGQGDEAIFTIGSDSRIRFTYRCDRPVRELRLQLFCPQQDDNFHHLIEDPAIGTWTTVALPLVALRPNDPEHPERRLAVGDDILLLQIMATPVAAGAAVLQIDDLHVLEAGP